MKNEWRKHEKTLYLPKQEVQYLTTPKMKYFTLKGKGNPNDPSFCEYIGVLYSLSYGVKMSYKWEDSPKSYSDYTVYPLEGIWKLEDDVHIETVGFNKDNLSFELMIRQPNFVDEELVSKVMDLTKKKKPHPLLDEVEFKIMEDGPCVQIMHHGSYDTEPLSFALLDRYCTDHQLQRISSVHREIYLKDNRKTKTENLRTVLRYQVE